LAAWRVIICRGSLVAFEAEHFIGLVAAFIELYVSA
jgi:hypothetical protein